jgi:poly-gamma-glutamate biosynthesis protein PgsC/CapC
MHDYFFVPEVVRVALVIGVVVSILFYERLQLTTGGAIVPAYLAMFLPAPLFVAATLLTGYLTYVVVNQVVGRRWILYGRRKFEIEILVGLGLMAAALGPTLWLTGVNPLWAGLSGIGFLVPGVIAHDMFRQRPSTTLFALLATTAMVAATIYVFASLLEISPLGEDLRREPPNIAAAGYPLVLLLPAVAVSVVTGMALFSRIGLRSGGFVTGAYLALVAEQPLDLVFAAAVALITWALVTQAIMPRLLVFGRRKLSSMVLVGAVVAWTAQLVVEVATGGAYTPWSGFVLMTLMVPALLANDAQRQGIERTAWGAAISAVVVFASMNLLAAALVAVEVLENL